MEPHDTLTSMRLVRSTCGALSPLVPASLEERPGKIRCARGLYIGWPAPGLHSAGLPDKGSRTGGLYMLSNFLGAITGLARVRSSLPCAL